jgi:hypothetical protein
MQRISKLSLEKGMTSKLAQNLRAEGASETTAASELLCTATATAPWHFPQENATFRGFKKCTLTLKLL